MGLIGGRCGAGCPPVYGLVGRMAMAVRLAGRCVGLRLVVLACSFRRCRSVAPAYIRRLWAVLAWLVRQTLMTVWSAGAALGPRRLVPVRQAEG